jgi:hypothetical protein
MSDNPVRWHGVRPVSFEAQEMLCHAYVGMPAIKASFRRCKA